jgi:hypothetical protein
MKHHILAILILTASGCGEAAIPDDHISKITQRLQPVAEDWRAICNTGRACIEASGEDAAEFNRVCRRGWQAMETIKAYQSAYCALRGLECSKTSSNQ